MASTDESAGESKAADVGEPLVPQAVETRRSEVDLHLRTMALEAAANAILIADRGGVIVWTNPAFSVLTGYSRAELVGKSTTLLRSDAQSEAFYEEMTSAVLAGRMWKGVLISRRKDGSLYDEEMTITPVLSGGEVTHFISVQEDVTERRRVEEGVKQQAERLRLAIDGAALATWHWDIVTGRETWSDRWYAMFGLPPGTVGTRETFLAMVHRDDREILKATRANALTGSPFDAQYRVLRRDGSEHWIASKGRAYFDAGGKPVRMEGVARDVTTEYKRLEEQLRQARKMEAVGRLAGGIAHDFNNLMAVILGYTEILLARTDATPVQRAKLAHILKASERAASLTRPGAGRAAADRAPSHESAVHVRLQRRRHLAQGSARPRRHPVEKALLRESADPEGARGRWTGSSEDQGFFFRVSSCRQIASRNRTQRTHEAPSGLRHDRLHYRLPSMTNRVCRLSPSSEVIAKFDTSRGG